MLSCHALKVFEELGSEHGRAHTHNHLGVMYSRQCQWDSAKLHQNAACRIWKEKQDGHSLFNGLTNLGVLYLRMGKQESALRILNDASQIAEMTGELSMVARVWNNIALAHRFNLDWGRANEYAKKAEAIFRDDTDYYGLANVWNNLGLIAHGSQNHAEALNYLEKSLELHQNLNNQAGIMTVLEDMQRVAA